MDSLAEGQFAMFYACMSSMQTEGDRETGIDLQELCQLSVWKYFSSSFQTEAPLCAIFLLERRICPALGRSLF